MRHRLMQGVLSASGAIRFAARASLEALHAALPAEQAKALEACAWVRPAALSVPNVISGARQVRADVGAAPLAVTVSRLVSSKRVELAIEAAHRLRPRVTLGVVGEGPDRDRLIKLPGARDVRFTGLLPRDHALSWIAAADVLVHTSAAEAAPTVVREARLLGTPVVACDAGDVRRWAASDRGIVVVEPEPDAIATAIDLLLASGAAHATGVDHVR